MSTDSVLRMRYMIAPPEFLESNNRGMYTSAISIRTAHTLLIN